MEWKINSIMKFGQCFLHYKAIAPDEAGGICVLGNMTI